jgi:hypothetical protein
MAILHGALAFTGTIDELSAYKMRGSNKVILRRKGGAGKGTIQNHPNFALTRRNNEEWKACVKAARAITLQLHQLRHLADYNFAPALTGLFKRIQAGDTVSEFGKRSILLTQAAHKMEGFSLTREKSFESILRHPLDTTIDRTTGTATIAIPTIVPGVNFLNAGNHPVYRIKASLCSVADIVYNEATATYIAATERNEQVTEFTEWYNAAKGSAAQPLRLLLPNYTANAPAALLLWVGIEFGIPLSAAEVKYVKYAGSAKLMRMV